MIDALVFIAAFACGFGAGWSLAWARIANRTPPDAEQAKKKR
jgi:hypothetical protein